MGGGWNYFKIVLSCGLSY